MKQPICPLLVALLPLALLPCACAEKSPLDPNQPYQAERKDPVTYDVEFSVVVTPPNKTKLLRVWLPIPPSDAGQEFSVSRLSAYPMNVVPQLATEPVYGNTFVYFEFKKPEGAQIIRHDFRVKVWELHWNVDPTKVEVVRDWPANFAAYRRTDRSVVVDQRFEKLAREIVPARSDPVTDLAKVMAWANDNLIYDHVNASLRASAEFALEKRCGHCSDYHGFCASLGRALGYPTRITYGINPFPKNSPSHCKLEVFLPPYGWVSYDVSETQRLIAGIRADAKLSVQEKGELIVAASARLARGFRDNTWYLQTKGTDYALVPPAADRVPVVRTIYAEADGVALPDPDPANGQKREFAWMTVHKYTPDRVVPYPFKDWSTLKQRN